MTERSEDLLGDLIPSKLSYDKQHQLKSVSRLIAPLDETKFVYLPDGTRIARHDPLGATGTIYIDGQEITITVAGREGALSLGARYYQHENTTVAIRQATGLTWQLNDHQASAQLSVASGTTIATRTYYDPYGNRRTGSLPPSTDRGWLGQTEDPTTGLTHLGARYYDPELSRFITTDPLVADQNAQAGNAYNYAASNPNMWTDPSGLRPTCGDGCDQDYEYNYGSGEVRQTTRARDDGRDPAAEWDRAYTERGRAAYPNDIPLPRNVTSAPGGSQERKEALINFYTNYVQTSPDIPSAAVAQFRDAMCEEVRTCGGGAGLLALGRSGTSSANYVVKGGSSLVATSFRKNSTHIFRKADGHLSADTPANRAIIREALEPAHLRSSRTLRDGSKLDSYFKTRADGTQAWAQVRGGEITNGGLNVIPR